LREKGSEITYEEISELNVLPKVFPDFFLGRSWFVNKVATDFNM